MRVSVDTNILVYAVDPNDRAKQASAIELLRRLSLGDNALLEHCLFEFLNATSRKLGVPIALSIATVAEWTANFDVILSNESVLTTAAQLLTRYRLSVWDARVLAICGANGVEFLLTEDMQDGAKYGTVTAVNPFDSVNDKLINGILPQ